MLADKFYSKNKSTFTIEDKMRILANLLIDRFLEDKKNHRLKFILNPPNIKLD